MNYSVPWGGVSLRARSLWATYSRRQNKKMKKIALIIIIPLSVCALTLFVAGDFKARESSNNFLLEIKTEPQKKTNDFEQKLNGLNLEQKIGQLFIVGFEGKKLTPDTEKMIKELHPGGILLLKRNIENENQLKELIDSLQKTALEDTGLPLFIAIDEEGGMVSRLEWLDKFSQQEIENQELAYKIGEKRADALKNLGINLNLAPVLDAGEPGDFIFKRGFQKEPKTSGILANALIRGQKEAGVLVAIKHFLGYGGISFNPEEKLAVIDGIPEISQFKEANNSCPEMVMVSNAVYKEVDKDLPFSFSPRGIEFLRNELKGDYLIISDDLAQNSLLRELSLEEIVSLPIKAGVDVLIFSGWRLPVEDGVLAFRGTVKKGEILEARINQSVLKIIETKSKIEVK